MGKSIFFMVPYPLGKAPSQRFRFEQYFNILKEAGYTYEIHSFYSDKTWNILHQEGNFTSKTLRIIASFFIRFNQLFHLKKYDYIFIHREVAPIGPPLFEWLISKILRKKIIYEQLRTQILCNKKKTRHFCRVKFLSLVSTPPELVFLF